MALYHDSCLMRSGMARVNQTRNHTAFTSHSPTHTFIHKWNEPLLPSRRASQHFGWYSFPVPLRVGGWVGLGGLVKYWGGLPAEDGHPSQYTNRDRHRVTSLIRPTTLPLRHAATYLLRRYLWCTQPIRNALTCSNAIIYEMYYSM